MFEKVTYSQYSNVLGRSVIPDEQSFNKLKLTNCLEMKNLLPYLTEKEANGIDSAVCMMIEKEYALNEQFTQNKIIASENVSGHSVSFDNSLNNKNVELNAKSLAEQKIEAIRLFCFVDVGVA